MPARLNRSAPELRAKEAREREQARIRQANKRARDRDAQPSGLRDVSRVTVTAPPENGALPAPPIPPVTSCPQRRKERAARITLRAFRDRGYVDDTRFWAKVAENYPGLDVELEAMKISDWLNQPGHAKRLCSRSFLDQWFRRAASGTYRATVRAVPANGHDSVGAAAAPSALLPAGVSLERIDPRVAARALSEAKRLTLPEKLELAKNGRHR